MNLNELFTLPLQPLLTAEAKLNSFAHQLHERVRARDCICVFSAVMNHVGRTVDHVAQQKYAFVSC